MIKNLIRSQQDEAKDKKRRDLGEKRMKARGQLHDKMTRDEQERMEHEHSVQNMEREEAELIQRLKDTQAMQQAAF